MVGEIPLNEMGPPWMIVMVPIAKRVVSALEVATTVNVAVVGMAVGAVYKPLVSMEPQPDALPETVQVGSEGNGTDAVGVPCVTSQVTPLFSRSFVKVAVNCTCDEFAALELVGTVAVGGVNVTTIPESRLRVALPVFFISSADVAVMITCRSGKVVGSGTLLGAV